MRADKRKAKKSLGIGARAPSSANTTKTQSATSASATTNRSWTVPIICAVIAVLTGFVFAQTLRHNFVNYDDDIYVYENSLVQKGLTAKGISWAFSHVVASNWHPLTVISHMLDCQFYGLKPGGPHLTNVLLHAAAAILLFLVLRRMTNATWPSAFVATVFAVHPLRVESVAWISERKDVLSGVFFMLTIAAYIRYTRGPWSLARYLPVPIFFALGLMAKPMLVSLPFVLLLLDYWPLKRAAKLNLLWEKIPLFLLSGGACAATLWAQSEVLHATETIYLSTRLANAIISTTVYVKQFFYPNNLAVFYPYPANGLPFGEIILSAIFLLAITTAAFRWRRRFPWLITGWIWYLVMLAPVIGLVQAGMQAHADRYTYLPEIGLAIAITWSVVKFAAKWPNRRLVCGVGSAIITIALVFTARAQTTFWRNSETLWTHTLDCTTNNAVAESNLANYLLHENRLDEAISHATAALEIKSDYADAHNCLGYALLEKGHATDAIPHFQTALKANPNFAAAHNNLGLAFMQSARWDDAIAELRTSIQISDDSADAHSNLGIALLRTGQPEASVTEYEKAIQLNPDSAGANNNLAWLLATCPLANVRNGSQAIQLAKRARQISGPDNLIIVRTLAAAYAEAGNYSEAAQTAEAAIRAATAQGKPTWIKTLDSDLELYRAGQPLRDAGRQ